MSEPLDALMKVAVAEGTKLGCDVLVPEALYEQRQGTSLRNFPNGLASWLFTCGVFDASRQAEESAQLADAAAEKIVLNEFGEIVCTSEERTGSHIRKRVCRLPGAYPNIRIVHVADSPSDQWY